MTHPTKIDIPQETREQLIKLLQGSLTAGIDLQLQCKQAHWNVKGPHFIALHDLFDQVQGVVEGFVDEIAERLTALGGTAVGTVGDVAKNTSLPSYPTDIFNGNDHVDAFSTALAAFGKLIRTNIDRAGEIGDADTEDLFTGVSRGIDQQLWFVEAHMQSDA